MRDISTLEPKGTRVLHGKTGAGSASDLESRSANHLVWQVGWIEGGATAVPYAAWLEVSGGTIDDARAKRDELLRASLAELDALLSASASVLARISLATTNT